MSPRFNEMSSFVATAWTGPWGPLPEGHECYVYLQVKGHGEVKRVGSVRLSKDGAAETRTQVSQHGELVNAVAVKALTERTGVPVADPECPPRT